MVTKTNPNHEILVRVLCGLLWVAALNSYPDHLNQSEVIRTNPHRPALQKSPAFQSVSNHFKGRVNSTVLARSRTVQALSSHADQNADYPNTEDFNQIQGNTGKTERALVRHRFGGASMRRASRCHSPPVTRHFSR